VKRKKKETLPFPTRKKAEGGWKKKIVTEVAERGEGGYCVSKKSAKGKGNGSMQTKRSVNL